MKGQIVNVLLIVFGLGLITVAVKHRRPPEAPEAADPGAPAYVLH